MIRADLIALTPEILAQLANIGLVKRASKALADGDQPDLTLAEDGHFTARFADGHTVTWPPGKALDQSQCTCPAPVCRHRVQAVLAYRAQHDNPVVKLDSPHLLDETALEAWTTPPQVKAANALCAQGLTVELRGVEAGEPCPTARLPMATVRFWGGTRLTEARCDCAQQNRCEHMLLALRAWRKLPRDKPPAPIEHVRLEPTAKTVGIVETASASEWSALPGADQKLIAHLWQQGAASGSQAFARLMGDATQDAITEGAVWIRLLLEELSSWIDAYEQRSGHFLPHAGASLVAELALRRLAARQKTQRGAALGIRLSYETQLATARLVTLGCRIHRNKSAREAQLIMADLATHTRLSLHHRWTLPATGTGPEDERRLQSQQRLAPRVGLTIAACGQLFAQRARRLANQELQLHKGRANANQVLPQNGDWSGLGPPIRFERLADVQNERRQRPVSPLRPRIAQPDFVVLSLKSIEHLGYDPALQTLTAIGRDADHVPVRIQRQHRAHAPFALDALAAALGSADLRHVAGVLTWQGTNAIMTPWAAAGNGSLVMPDLASPSGALAKIALIDWDPPDDDPLTLLLERLRDWLGLALLRGIVRQRHSLLDEARNLAEKLETAGFTLLAEPLNAFLKDETPENAAEALTLLAMLGYLHEEAVKGER